MTATFISMFEEPVLSWLNSSIIARAHKNDIIKTHLESILASVAFNHHAVDDTPYGGGPGELMKINIIAPLIEKALARNPDSERHRKRVLLMDPAGQVFTQTCAKRLSQFDELIFVSGRYEGIDARVHHFVDEAISIGDYVLSSGDVAAMVIFDATVRMIEGVLGNKQSSLTESHAEGRLESSQYTRPPVYQGFAVPPVLQSGNHAEINRARNLESLYRTNLLRPDLIDKFPLTSVEKDMLKLPEKPTSYPWMKSHE